MALKLFFFTLLTFSGVVYAQESSSLDYKSAYLCEGQEKFNWYCDEEEVKEEVQKVEKVEPKPAVTPVETKPKELVEFEDIQKKLEELLQIAYVNPSDENIYNYIAYQNQVTNKAAIFADKWKRVQWINPELDYSQRFPTSKMAKSVRNKDVLAKQEFNLKHLAQEGYGIFFFYKSDCSYCHQMEYPVKLLAKRSGLDILSIATDGVIVDKFPNSVADAGQTASLGVTQTPTIMLINHKTKDIQPIATGWVSLQELEKRIYVLTATRPGDNF